MSHTEIMRLLAEREAVPTPRTPPTRAMPPATTTGKTTAQEVVIDIDEASWEGLEPVSAVALPVALPTTPAPLAMAPEAKPTAVAMEAYFAEGNYEAAMVVAEALLERDPNHAAARECLERCDLVLVTSYTTDLVQLTRVPVLTVSGPELGTPPLSPEKSAILALVDGKRTIEDILAASGAAKLEGLRALAELAILHAIDF
jgi:predicted nucleic acid-binding protein